MKFHTGKFDHVRNNMRHLPDPKTKDKQLGARFHPRRSDKLALAYMSAGQAHKSLCLPNSWFYLPLTVGQALISSHGKSADFHGWMIALHCQLDSHILTSKSSSVFRMLQHASHPGLINFIISLQSFPTFKQLHRTPSVTESPSRLWSQLTRPSRYLILSPSVHSQHTS